MSRFVARLRRLLPGVPVLMVCAVICTAGGSPASCQEWRVNKARSSVSLQLSMNGQPMKGRFSAYKVTIRFDPEEAADGEITALIDAGSLATGDTAHDALLYGPDWLNASAYPAIRLTSVSIREQEAPDYRLQADLALRGVTRRIAVPLTVDDKGDAGKVHAEIRINPGDFGMAPGAGELVLIIDLTATHLTN